VTIQLYPAARGPRLSRILRDLAIVGTLVFLAWVGREVYLRVDSVVVVANGVTAAGESVQGSFDNAADAIGSLPLVGDELAQALGSSGDATGGNVADSVAPEKRPSTTQRYSPGGDLPHPAGLLLALTIPNRVRGIRRMSEAQRFIGDITDPERRRLLAMRAAFSLPIDLLLDHTADPIGDLIRADHDRLLEALCADTGTRGSLGSANESSITGRPGTS